MPLTTLTGAATLYGQNLMDTPYRVPDPLKSWLQVATAPRGSLVVQGPSTMHRAHGFDRWQDHPDVTGYTFDTPGTWSLLEPRATGIDVSGRLIGGCIETVSMPAGTRYGDLGAFTWDHADGEGLIMYLEAAEDQPYNIARDLWRMRLAGWFDSANAIMLGRTAAPDRPLFGQTDAARSALADLDIPIVIDVDRGHVAPYLALVNGARTRVVMTDGTTTITQQL